MAVTAKRDPGRVRAWRRYPAYKPSGVEWLGDVPEGWDQSRLRFLCSITTGSKNTEDNDPSGEYPFFVRSDIIQRLHTYSFDEEAILTAGDGAIAKVFHYYKGKFDVHQRVYVLTQFKGILGYFLYFYFSQNLADEVVKLSAKSTVDSLRLPMLQNFPVLIPTPIEQPIIAAFLDRETARIDALIGKKERQIELLQEKRAALISHAVTKGLDQSVPMKDSGVEWLEMVPEGWEVIPLKYGWQVIDCKHVTAEYVDDGIPIVSTTEVKPGRLSLENTRQTTETDFLNSIDGRCPKKGDIIYSRNASLGSAAYVDTNEKFCMGQDVCLITSISNIQLFLTYQLNSPVVLSQIDAQMIGSTIKRINVEQIKNLIIVCPPADEQRKIAEYLDTTIMKLDSIAKKINESIEKLREYRSALISAAVTGKIDVRQEAKA